MNSEHLAQLDKLWLPIFLEQTDDGEVLMAVSLMYHTALYLNPRLDGSFEDRFCYSNDYLAFLAVCEYRATGEFVYWQKWWTRNLRVENNGVYGPDQVPGRDDPLYTVAWNAAELREEFPHQRTMA
jgi:hypothetical protein